MTHPPWPMCRDDAKNHVHLDLRTSDLAAEVSRITGGALESCATSAPLCSIRTALSA